MLPATTGIGPHPLGHPRRAQRPQRPPAPRLHRHRSRSSTTASSRTSRRCGPSSSRAATSWCPTPTPRRSRTCSRRRPRAARSTSPTRCGASAAGSKARSPSSPPTPTTPTSWSGARRNSPLVVGRGAGRELPRLRRRGVHRAHPRRGRARPGPGRRAAPRRRHRHRLRRQPGRGARVPRRLGPVGRREGRLRLLHAQGDRRAAAGGRRHAARPASDDDGRLVLDEMRLSDEELREIDKIIIVACGTAFHAGLIAKYAIEHWTRIPCEVELASEFRYRDPILTRTTLVIAISQSGETMDTLMALRHAREQRRQGAGDLQHQRLDDPARVRRRALHARRARGRGRVDQGFLTQIVACYLVGALPRPGARHQVRRRDRRGRRRAARDAGQDGHACSSGMEPVRALARRAARRDVGALPRPARRLPGGAGGRAQAQGARVHARRGLRGRRAQARADRADRGGRAGHRRRCRRRGAAASCTTRWCRNIQEIRARGARTIVIAEEGDEAVVPYADAPDPHPAVADAAAAAAVDGAAAGVRLRDGHGPRSRRRPAAQPGQVGHGRVSPPHAG